MKKRFVFYFISLLGIFAILTSCKTSPQPKTGEENSLQPKLAQLSMDYSNLQKKDNALLTDFQNLKKTNDDSNLQIAVLKKQLEDFKKTNSDLRTTNMSKSDLELRINALTLQKDDFSLQLVQLQSKLDATNQKSLLETKRLKEIENYLKTELADLIKNGDAEIYLYAGILVVNFNDMILFDADSAVLKANFNSTLTKLATAFNKVPDRDIRIEGNTAANVPSKWASSWDLGAMRSVSIARFLQEKAGIDPQRIKAVSLGEFSPIASNDKEENRKKNRRVNILLVNRDLYDINKMLLVK